MTTTGMEVVVAGRIVHTVAAQGGGLWHLKGLSTNHALSIKYLHLLTLAERIVDSMSQNYVVSPKCFSPLDQRSNRLMTSLCICR